MDHDARHGFVSTQPAATWEEGLICGNGTIGTCALSRPWDETVILTHERMWLPTGAPTLPAETGPRLFEIRRLIDRGLYHQASQLAFDISGQDGFLYPDPFAPIGDLTLRTQTPDGAYSDYSRRVDFRTGEATIQWNSHAGRFERRMFVSRAHNVAAIQLTGPGEGALNCELSLGPREPGDGMPAQKIAHSYERFFKHVQDIKTEATDKELTYQCAFSRPWPGSVRKLLAIVRVVAQGGRTSVRGSTLSIADATGALLLIGIELMYDQDHDGTELLRTRLDSASDDYEQLLEHHAGLHGRLFNRVSLDLGGGADHALPSEKLLEMADHDHLSPALLEKEFDAGRHNIISSSGDLPPALQGIWGGTHVADWAGDFTHNGNVPSAIASMLMGNTPELMLSYTRYMEYLLPYMQLNAQRMFNARGIVLPSRTSTHGFNNALAPRFAGGFWTAGAAWAAHFFYDYWLYTGDREFLAKHALPFMEQAVLFFEDFLYEGADGTYIFSPTQSPENTPANSNNQASFNATMDVAAVRELLENLVAASELLGVNRHRIETWKTMLRKMPEYMISEDGMIKEWLTPKLQNNDNHRHASHLYALYDGIPEAIAASPELREAFRKSIRYKLDRHWSRNTTGFMSFGLVQLGQAAASLGDGEMAYECVVHLANRFWLNNLASMHNHKSLLNMDISGGMPAVVMKMLITSAPGHVVLLPALPAAWPTGSLAGVLCRGAIEVKQLHWQPGRIDVTLYSKHDQTIALDVPSAIERISGPDGVLLAPARDNRQSLALAAGAETALEIRLH